MYRPEVDLAECWVPALTRAIVAGDNARRDKPPSSAPFSFSFFFSFAMIIIVVVAAAASAASAAWTR